jgi:multicomponent Na+:H+ antiporter subunit F
MHDASLILAFFLLFNLIGGLIRVLRGPTPADSMLAAQLFGTTGVAILTILAKAMKMPALLDVALLFALLAAVVVVAFVMRFWASASERK